MTKVLMNSGLLGYQRKMLESLRQVLRQNTIGGVRQARPVDVPAARGKLLTPPRILLVTLKDYAGQGDDYIGIAALHVFGIQAMQVTIVDERGNPIESGDAYPFRNAPELWGFYPAVCVPAGTTVTVQVTAFDAMGGVGSRRVSKRLS